MRSADLWRNNVTEKVMRSNLRTGEAVRPPKQS